MTNLTIIRGDSVTVNFTFQSGGAAYDITGATCFFTVKKSADEADADASISKSWTSHTTPTSGLTTLALSSTDTNLTPGVYVFDTQVKASNGSIFSITPGTVTVVADVTIRTT